jgi:monoamine oxidase
MVEVVIGLLDRWSGRGFGGYGCTMRSAVVIGAGFAGLSAADALRSAGVEVTVFEARDRVGGRVWSRELENGAVVEMGAEFILPGNTVVRELADHLGLGLWEKGMRYGQREPRGGPEVAPGALEAAIEATDAALASDPELGRLPAPRLLQQLKIEAGAREVLLARLEVSSASPADAVPAISLVGLAHVGDEVAPGIAGGNGRLPEALAAPLRDAIHLRTPARRVAWSEGGVTVGTAGTEIEADACVVAIPATRAADLAFEPALPVPVARALREVPYGHAAKLFVPLRAAATASAVISVPERYWTWTATADGGRVQPVVHAFAGSMPALDALGVHSGPDAWLTSLSALRPDLDLDPAGMLLSTWSDDPWVGAAYSTLPSAEITEALTETVGPLSFAGEHTAGEFAGLMEGAIRSGRRAAAAIRP